MSDIKLVLKQTTEGVKYYDFDISAEGDFVLTDGLDTALLMSVFCEKRDETIEVPLNRGGWSGNELNDTNYQIGSLLWTKYQSAMDAEIADDVNDILIDGNQWFIDDGILDNVEAETNADFSRNSIDSVISTFQNNDETNIQFSDLLGN